MSESLTRDDKCPVCGTEISISHNRHRINELLAVIEQCEKALQSCHWNGSEMVYNYEGVSKALAAIKKVNEGK